MFNWNTEFAGDGLRVIWYPGLDCLCWTCAGVDCCHYCVWAGAFDQGYNVLLAWAVEFIADAVWKVKWVLLWCHLKICYRILSSFQLHIYASLGWLLRKWEIKVCVAHVFDFGVSSRRHHWFPDDVIFHPEICKNARNWHKFGKRRTRLSNQRRLEMVILRIKLPFDTLLPRLSLHAPEIPWFCSRQQISWEMPVTGPRDPRKRKWQKSDHIKSYLGQSNWRILHQTAEIWPKSKSNIQCSAQKENPIPNPKTIEKDKRNRISKSWQNTVQIEVEEHIFK